MRLLAGFLLGMSLYAAPAVVYYSDLTNGPKTGGENNLGVYVTVNGVNFGSSQGTSTLTVGGGTTTIKSWSDKKIVFQPGPSAATGNIVVTTGGQPSSCYISGTPMTTDFGTDLGSNCLFTVRAGNIYCVSNAGNDSHDGKFPTDPTGNGSGCWASVASKLAASVAGNTYYVGSAVGETYQIAAADRSVPSIILYFTGNRIHTNCTATNSCGLVGYPGATAIIGGTSTAFNDVADVVRAIAGPFSYWTFSNLHFLTPTTSTVQAGAILNDGSPGWRVINCEITMSSGANAAAINWAHVGRTDYSRQAFIFGNYIHAVNSRNGNARTVHYIYGTGDSNGLDIGWNHLDGSDSVTGSCRAVHIHSSPFPFDNTNGFPQHGIYVHDNLIEHMGCNAVDMGAADPSPEKGGYWVYNNIFNDVGNGRGAFSDAPTCSVFLTSMNNTTDYNWQYVTGTVHVVNNTIYGSTGACVINPGSRGMWADAPWCSNGGGCTGGWSTLYFRPQSPDTLCAASGCNHTRWTGTMTLDAYPALGMWPGMNNFVVRGTGTRQQVYDTWVSFKCDADMTPNGAGVDTCVELYQAGVRADGGGAKGSLNLTTGAYDFSFQTLPATNSTIAYHVTQAYKIDFSNNIFYVQPDHPWYFSSSEDFTAQRRIFTGTNNLFYSLTDPNPPANIPGLASPFTTNVGSNTNPLFVTNGSDFHLQSGSVARAAGITVGISGKDYDGVPRPQEANYAVGAYEYNTGYVPPVVDPLVITTTTLADGQQTVPYSQPLNATGGTTPFTWSLFSGTICTGLSVNSVGTITGTPTTVQTCSFTVQVADSALQTDTQALSITITAASSDPRTRFGGKTTGGGNIRAQ